MDKEEVMNLLKLQGEMFRPISNLKIQIDNLMKCCLSEGIRLGEIKGLESHEKITLGFKFVEEKKIGYAFSSIEELEKIMKS